MKPITSILFLALVLFSCTKSDKVDSEITSSEKIEPKKKYDLPYLQELEDQKKLLNEKVEFWSARALFTDATEEILDLDINKSAKNLLYLSKLKDEFFLYTLSTKDNASPRLIRKETRPLAWAKFYLNQFVIYAINETNQNSYIAKLDLTKSMDQLPEIIFNTTGETIKSSHMNDQGVMAVCIESNDSKTSRVELIKNGIKYKEFEHASDPSWSFNDKSLVFISKLFGQPEIAIWSSEHKGIKRFSISDGGNKNPGFSPDSNWIIYNKLDKSNNHLYVRNIDDTFPQLITKMQDMKFSNPKWGIDNQIYAIGKKGNQSYLFQFKSESKMFQVRYNGEPGPKLDTPTPMDHAQKEIKESL